MPLTDDFATIQWTSAKGATNSTTPQTVVSDPGSGAQPYIVAAGQFTFRNADTVSSTMIVTITGGTSRIVENVTLASGDKFVNDGTYVISAGETMTVELASAITTNQSVWSCAYYQIIS